MNCNIKGFGMQIYNDSSCKLIFVTRGGECKYYHPSGDTATTFKYLSFSWYLFVFSTLSLGGQKAKQKNMCVSGYRPSLSLSHRP